MALEHVVPVVPQGTFSVTTRKLSWAVPAAVVLWAEERPAGVSMRRGSEQARGGRGSSVAVYLEQRVLAVPAEAVAPPVEGEVVAVPVHLAGGQAGPVGALPRPTLTGAGGQCPPVSPHLPARGPSCPPHAGRAGPRPLPEPPPPYQVLQPTRMVWPGW